MAYEPALSNAWKDLKNLAQEENYSVQLLNDNYTVNLKKEEIFSLSCNIPTKPYTAILILHYLVSKLKGLAAVKGEWISFKELVGGQGYYSTFKKRVIEPVLRKYGTHPEKLVELIERFKAKRAQLADVSVVLETFDSVPILITFWRGDEEFSAGANVLFDKSITDIFCTEDIVVLSEYVVHSI